MRRTVLLLVPVLVAGAATALLAAPRPALACFAAPAPLDLESVSFSARFPGHGALARSDVGSGAESPAMPGARTVIVILGAGSALIGFVLLAVVASLGEPDPLPRRSSSRSDTQAPD